MPISYEYLLEEGEREMRGRMSGGVREEIMRVRIKGNERLELYDTTKFLLFYFNL